LAIVNRLLEHSDPCLVPEPVAQKGGRVAGHGQRGCRGQLDRVVGAREVGRVDAKVHLERAVRPFQRDILAGQLERVLARDPDAERVVAEPPQTGVQRPVARHIRDHAGTQVSLPQGGQNANEREPARVVSGGVGHVVKQHVQLAAERGEWPAGQRGR
jgi:hypothetical protein